MGKTHWKQLVNPEYLGAYSISDGRDMTLTIKQVQIETVTGPQGKKEQCPVARFAEDVKPMILNRTNMKTIQKIFKTPFVEEWAGRKIQVFPTTTKFGGEVVECLRVRPFAPAAQDSPVCAECGEEIQAFGRMDARGVADYTLKKYGKLLCGACATECAEIAKSDGEKEDALK